MRLVLIAVGRLRTGAERELVEHYRARAEPVARGLGLRGPDLVELPEARARSAAERQAAEGNAILARAADAALLVLDERGSSPTSRDVAAALGGWRDRGRSAALVVGGPDGLADTVRARGDLVLCFGRMTLPHGLARVLAAEQLYRALTILSGHPYHREG